MNYQEKWKVRKKHLLIWGVVILVIVGVKVYFSFKTTSLFRTVRSGVATTFWMLWFLPPITLVRARNGSIVSDFARSVSGNGESGGGEAFFEKEYYNLNNAGDSFLYGLEVVVVIFRFTWMLIKLGWYGIKYLICYLIVAIPFPFETYYYYLKSRDKIKKMDIVVPVVSFLLISVFLGVSGIVMGNEYKASCKISAENALKEAGKVRISVAELDDYEGIYFTVMSETEVRAGAGAGYDVIETVKEGNSYVGTSRADVEEDVVMWYEIYLNDAKTETGWISAGMIEQDYQEKFDIRLSSRTKYSGIYSMVGGKVIRALEEGEVLKGTGNVYNYEEGSSSFWFEVYADEGMIEKAWVPARYVGSVIYVVDKME